MQKIIESTRRLSISVGLPVSGLYDEVEVPRLISDGYVERTNHHYEASPGESPLSIELGMGLHPMIDPHFPPSELVDGLSVLLQQVRSPETKRIALVYRPEMNIDVYISPTTGDNVERDMIDGIDVTDEVHYNAKGKATQVVSYCLFNGAHLAKSVYGLNSRGEYTEWHEDPEHGSWPNAEVVGRERLETLDRHNPHTLPRLLILGSNEQTVREIAQSKKKNVKHLRFSPKSKI